MKRRLFLVSLLATLPLPLRAQTLEEEEALFSEEGSEEQFFKLEEEAVTIASKHVQTTREAPASITVLSAEDIFRFGFRDMEDLLRFITGWYVSDNHDFVYGGVRGVLLRGDQNTRILVLIDGHTQNEAWASSSSLDEALGLDLNAVARVEVLQGPSSTLYGTNAFLGIINIVTKSGADMARAAAHLELGSFGRTQAVLSSGRKQGELEYHARAGVQAASGRYLYFPERAATSATAGYSPPSADALLAYNGFLKVNWKKFQFLGQYVERIKHIPTAPYDTVLGSDETYYRQRRWFGELKFNHDLSSSLHLMARAYADGFRYEDYLLLNAPDPGGEPTRFRDNGYADWYGGELQVGLTLVDRARVRDQLYLGTEATYVSSITEAFETADYEDPVPADAINIDRAGTNLAGYLQNELDIAQTVSVVLGLRFDYNSDFAENTSIAQNLSPRGAVIVRTRSDSTFKLIYAKGFRNPSLYEAFAEDGVDILANPELRPESIQNLELVYQYQWKKRLKLALSNYFFRADDLLRQETVCLETDPETDACIDARQQFQNHAQVDGLGVEGTLQAQLPRGIQGRATLAVQKATERTGDGATTRMLVNSPTVVGNLGAAFPLIRDKAFLSAQLHYVGGRVVGPDASGDYVDVPPYLLGNLVFAARDLVKGLDLSAGVYNVLDLEYQDIAATEKIVIDRTDDPLLTVSADGRTFAFKLSYRY